MRSGNGLEAQERDIQAFASSKGYSLVAGFCEDVSGKYDLDRRPQLAKALALAKKEKAFLVVNKLDRLSRDAHFILSLMKMNVKFIVTSLGEDIDDFSLHIFSSLAQMERKMIGERTKAALQSLKQKGKALGFSIPKLAANQKEISSKGVAAIKKEADAFAQHMQPTISRMIGAGMSYNAIARELNVQGNKTQRGGAWTAKGVINIVNRF